MPRSSRPREMEGPGALPAESLREGCRGWWVPPHPAGWDCCGVSAHPKKRGSQRGPQKQEKTRGSEAAPRPPPPQRTSSRASGSPSGHAPPQATPLPPAQALCTPAPDTALPRETPPLPAHVWNTGHAEALHRFPRVPLRCPGCVAPGAPSHSRPWGSPRGRPRAARTARFPARAQPSGPAQKSSRACASRLSCGTRRAPSRVSAGAGRGGEHVRARRVPAAALCQAHPSSVPLFGPEPQSRAFRFAHGETEAAVLGHTGSRAAWAAVGPHAALPCLGLSATARGPALLGCDSSTRLHASLGREHPSAGA